MLGPMRFGGHSIQRPPKKCSVCRKQLVDCKCKRCIHNIIAKDRTPSVCDECKAEADKR
jgi:hypothetical protein